MIKRIFQALVLSALATNLAQAAPDEIQVYADDLNARGEAELEVHVNYAVDARATPDYPGERPPRHVLRVTPEFSFGLGGDWDMGFYLPLARSADGTYTNDGGKVRLKYLHREENGGNSLFYGLNTEVGYSPRRAAESYWNAEFRGIVGVRRGDWLLVANPILGWDMSRNSEPDLDLSVKIARKVSHDVTLGIEHYAELGPVNHTHAWRESGQTTYAVAEFEMKGWELHLGVGHGWTDPADKTTVKAIVTLPF